MKASKSQGIHQALCGVWGAHFPCGIVVIQLLAHPCPCIFRGSRVWLQMCRSHGEIWEWGHGAEGFCSKPDAGKCGSEINWDKGAVPSRSGEQGWVCSGQPQQEGTEHEGSWTSTTLIWENWRSSNALPEVNPVKPSHPEPVKMGFSPII